MFLAQSGTLSNSNSNSPRRQRRFQRFIFHDFAPSELGSASRNPTSIFIHQVAETWERWFGIGEDLSCMHKKKVHVVFLILCILYIDIWCMYLDCILSTYFLIWIDAKNWTQKFHPITLAHGHENPQIGQIHWSKSCVSENSFNTATMNSLTLDRLRHVKAYNPYLGEVEKTTMDRSNRNNGIYRLITKYTQCPSGKNELYSIFGETETSDSCMPCTSTQAPPPPHDKASLHLWPLRSMARSALSDRPAHRVIFQNRPGQPKKSGPLM